MANTTQDLWCFLQSRWGKIPEELGRHWKIILTGLDFTGMRVTYLWSVTEMVLDGNLSDSVLVSPAQIITKGSIERNYLKFCAWIS